ncbi:hypothetical protein IV417_13285 [Alphaproteobacteria bacterium KMM 3653]|uniref:DoxX protein n=1 Tax=Harenicola maris TaxID=2841044 RepID=A0AAP2CQB4_9RHOB|nr:hypothetical protein [Harenicola maris]
MTNIKLSASLLIIRLTIAAFFGAWASLKFYRPEWFENVFTNMYGLGFVTQDLSSYVGIAQMLLLALFTVGLWRTFSYASLALMQGAGVLGSIPNLMNYTNYPNNLMWTAVPAFGAAVALFIMRNEDSFSVDGMRKRSPE